MAWDIGAFEYVSPGGSCTLSGTITTTAETEIISGGKTIVLTLSGDTWVSAGASFDAERQAILSGLDSAQSEATGWDAVVKINEVVGAVVRTSDTIVTITLSAHASYDITSSEIITATIPASALTGATALVAAPTFTITTVLSFIVAWARNTNTLLGAS